MIWSTNNMTECKWYEEFFVNNFEEFIRLNHNEIFRIAIYKRIFTPYEIENKFVDESIYEEYKCVKIQQLFKLDNDYLLGCQEVDISMGEVFDTIEFYKLSEIRLSYNPKDITDFNENKAFMEENRK